MGSAPVVMLPAASSAAAPAAAPGSAAAARMRPPSAAAPAAVAARSRASCARGEQPSSSFRRNSHTRSCSSHAKRTSCHTRGASLAAQCHMQCCRPYWANIPLEETSTRLRSCQALLQRQRARLKETDRPGTASPGRLRRGARGFCRGRARSTTIPCALCQALAESLGRRPRLLRTPA